MRLALLPALALALAAAAPAQAADPPVFEGPVPKADCGPGSMPETALQGEVTVADRDSGRSLKGYTCNLELVGVEKDPLGASWQHTWYEDCAYYDTRLASGLGTQVMDVTDPTKPERVRALQTPAMLDPWESLSVAADRPDGRKLLAGVYVNSSQGAAFFDLYDIAENCKNPSLVFSGPVSGLNHEGNWSMDGMTFYATGIFGGVITAINVDNPTAPTPLTSWYANQIIHGLSTSEDGNRLYLADITGQNGMGNGLSIWDTSGIQKRDPAAQPPLVGAVGWSDGGGAQHTIPVTIKGKPYVIFVDEGGGPDGLGMARIIDISDETKPRVISKLKLEIDMKQHEDRAAESAALSGGFGYNAHYCGVDQRTEPTVVGCSYFASGIRIFDIRDPHKPREIAYFNPGGTGEASPSGSQEGMSESTSGYPSARVRFIKERGEIWFTDQNKGFHVARFTNGVWPFKDAPSAPAPAPVGLPEKRTCLAKSLVTFRVPRDRAAKSAVITVNGKVVKRVRGKALRRKVGVRLPAGRHSVVRVVVATKQGKKVTQSRGYTRCA